MRQESKSILSLIGNKSKNLSPPSSEKPSYARVNSEQGPRSGRRRQDDRLEELRESVIRSTAGKKKRKREAVALIEAS